MSIVESSPGDGLDSQSRMILIIDDNPANLATIGRYLIQQGYQAMMARDGETGLQLARQDQPDLILLDVMLPGIDGFETCRRLKADERTREIPIIFMTALTSVEDKVKGFEVGGVDYITKPFQYEEVLARVTTHLALRAAQKQLAAQNAQLQQEMAERQQAEEALRKAHAELEQRVEERAAELVQANASLTEEIAERKRMEEALRESGEKYRQLVDTANEGVWVVDSQRQTIFVNARMAEMLGYRVEEMIGRRLDSFLFEQDLADHEMRMQRRRQGIAEHYERRYCTKDGQTVWTLLSATPLFDGEQRFQGSFAMLTDITERKRAEEELTQHRAHLEELVEQRTAELVVAKEQAEAANRAKSAFLANMSHELRTPLNGILGYAQLLQRDRALAASHLDAVNTIERSGQHLLTLITDILDLSRIEAGKLDLSPSDLHLPNFLQEIASLMYLRAAQQGLGFKHLPETALPLWVRADEKRLRQVLINLLSNAIKFTRQGEVTFHVKVREPAPHSIDPRPAPTVGLRFEVIDTGVGIAADQLERIFLPFEQASTRPQYLEGAGLGLAISRQLVRAMGGDIYVSSTVGEGSTFWFELVLPVISKGAVSPPAAAPYPIGYRGPRRKALIVDDQPDNRLILVDLLHSLGFDLREAENGQQAIASARDWQPDLILLDMFMPVLSGFEAASRLRQLPELAATIIIGISAGVSAADTQHILQAGCHAVMPKPIDVDKLLALLASHLKLEWMYPPVETLSSEPVEPERELIPPPPEELAIWYDLALQGNLRGIQARAAQLEQLDQQYQPFADQLQHLARNFEDKAVLALINRYMGEHS